MTEREVIDLLVKALTSLRRAPNCFCESGIGNPMVTRCSKACQEAKEALRLASEFM